MQMSAKLWQQILGRQVSQPRMSVTSSRCEVQSLHVWIGLEESMPFLMLLVLARALPVMAHFTNVSLRPGIL